MLCARRLARAAKTIASAYDESYLSIRTPDVLARIQGGDATWEQMVPAVVADIIKAENLFGWRPKSSSK